MTDLDPSAIEGAGDQLRQGRFRSTARTLAEEGLKRLRQGELGVMPVIFALAVIWTYFQLAESTHSFLTPRNISNLALQIAVTGTVAIGLVLVLLLGEIDLSVGSIAGLCSATLGVLIVNHDWPWWAAIVVIVAVGAAVGAFQGAWFAVVGVPAFVVTLAGFLGWQGVQLRVLGSTGTVNVFEPHISAIAGSYLPPYWGWILAIVGSGLYATAKVVEQVRRRRAGLPGQPLAMVAARTGAIAAVALGAVWLLNDAPTGGVPTAIVILLGLVIFFAGILRWTRFGRYVYAVGGNAEAARRAGVNVKGVRIAVFALSGTMAAIGGLIFVSRLGAASTQTGGGTFLLEAIAAAVIGGTSLFGGRGTIWSALLGALVIGSVSNGLDLQGQPAEVKLMVEGAILLLAVTVDAVARRGRAAAGR